MQCPAGGGGELVGVGDDLIDIVTALDARGVGVKSLTNGIIDTTTTHGKLVFGMFALMAEYEAALIRERTQRSSHSRRIADPFLPIYTEGRKKDDL